jgi:hypothetical protein
VLDVTVPASVAGVVTVPVDSGTLVAAAPLVAPGVFSSTYATVGRLAWPGITGCPVRLLMLMG